MLTLVMIQSIRRTKVRDVELNEYWNGGFSAKPILQRWVAPEPSTGSCSGKCKRRYRTAPQEQFESLLGAI
jgi:hypothetical protein